jgi:hypothetical protein
MVPSPPSSHTTGTPIVGESRLVMKAVRPIRPDLSATAVSFGRYILAPLLVGDVINLVHAANPCQVNTTSFCRAILGVQSLDGC